MQIITLGIGTPSTVAGFILFGLTPTGPVDLIEAVADYRVLLPADDLTVTMPADDLRVLAPSDDTTGVM